MPLSTPTLKLWLLTLTLCLFFFQSVKSSPDTQYNTFYPAIYLSAPQPGAASPPPAASSPAASQETPSPPVASPSSTMFSPAAPPACPVDNLSCDIIGEPSWCCISSQRCAFDDGGDVACCPLGDFCKGTVNYGAGGASGAGGGAPNDGTGIGRVTAGGGGGSTASLNQGSGGQGVETAGEGVVLWHSKAIRSYIWWGYARSMGLVLVAFISGMVVG